MRLQGKYNNGERLPKWLFAEGMPFNKMDNFFVAYKRTKPTGDRTVADVAKDFSSGRRGTYEYTIGGYSRYIIYEPLRVNDWFLINAIDGVYVSNTIRSSSIIPLALFLMIASGLFLIIVFIIKIEAKNRKMLEDEEARLRISAQQYKIAAQQSDNYIIRYDIKTKQAYRDWWQKRDLRLETSL